MLGEGASLAVCSCTDMFAFRSMILGSARRAATCAVPHVGSSVRRGGSPLMLQSACTGNAHARLVGRVRSLHFGRERVSFPPPRSPRFSTRRGFISMPHGDAGRIIGGIIGTNCAVFALWKLSESDSQAHRWMIRHFTVVPASVFSYPHTAVTSIFSHMDGWHLFGNCLTLFFFGPEVIGALGARTFLQLYLGAGVFASGCQALSSRRNTPALGASGALNAVVIWSVLSNPWALIIIPIEFLPIPMPACVFGLFYIGKDVYGMQSGDTRIGHGAHLGGAAVGIAHFLLTRRPRF